MPDSNHLEGGTEVMKVYLQIFRSRSWNVGSFHIMAGM